MRISSVASAAIALSSFATTDAFAPMAPRVSSHRAAAAVTTTMTATMKSPTALEAYVRTGESTPRNLPAFNEWATANGVQKIDGIELYSEDGLDWFAITTVDIPAGTTLMFVPSIMILNSANVKEELTAMSNGGVTAAVEQLVRIGSGGSIDQFYLFLKLLLEYENQENSPYFPWLDSLPRLYYNAISMTDFCYECLPPLVFSLSRLERVKFDNFSTVLQKVDILSPELKKQKDVLKWAFNAVHTRAYDSKEGQPPGQASLVPMADMFNHGTDTEVEVAFDEQGNCLVYTTTDVYANSPLRISYGCPTNPSMLFARYGFLDESSPATFCKMMDIPRTPDNVDMGMDFSKMLFYKDTGDISQEVMDVVLYAKVLGSIPYHPDIGDVKKIFYEAHVNGDEETKQAIHERYRYETVTAIKKHVDTFLQQLEELGKKSVGKSFEEHPRLPLILKHNEFVKETFLTVQANLNAFLEQYEDAREELVQA